MIHLMMCIIIIWIKNELKHPCEKRCDKYIKTIHMDKQAPMWISTEGHVTYNS